MSATQVLLLEMLSTHKADDISSIDALNGYDKHHQQYELYHLNDGIV